MGGLPLVLALTVAFPHLGEMLPRVSRTYVIGTSVSGATNVVVQGKSVPVFRTGAWATTVSVSPGTNVVSVVDGRVQLDWSFRVPAATNSVVRAAQAVHSAGTNGVAKAAKRTYGKLPYALDEPRPHPKGRARREVCVFIDPGHGGSDGGCVSPHGHAEKAFNLTLARALAESLEERGFRARLTRQDDTRVELYDRPKEAHRAKADAFISIHHNAPPVDGDAAAVRYVAVYAWNDLGMRLARVLAGRLAGEVRQANYAVTRSPEIPSCLVEADFVTHPAGEEASLNAAIIRRRASALAAGFADWYEGADAPEQKKEAGP